MDQFLFSDEAGDFTFNREPNVSRYFIICTVLTPNLTLNTSLIQLRHRLVKSGKEVGDCFHATTDRQEVRDCVFELLSTADFTFQVTICEKSKAQPQVRASKARFYQYPWFYHFKFGVARRLMKSDDLIVTAASIGTKKERQTYTSALNDVVGQSANCASWAVDFRPAVADPCLQAADYCAWAIQRKWERQDLRSFDLIKGKLTYEYELWKSGNVHYY